MKSPKTKLKYFLFALINIVFFIEDTTADGSWTQLNNFPGGARAGMFSFQIGSRYFAGGGTNGTIYFNDFYEYFPVTDSWQIRNFMPIAGLAYGISFTIDGKGYAGIGKSNQGALVNTFLQYNPNTNQWSFKQPFSGATRAFAIGEAINGKGYVGTGVNGGSYLGDLWEYNPSGNSWIQKNSMPAGFERYGAISFAVNNKLYVLGGDQISSNTIFEYNPITDSWLQKGGSVPPSSLAKAVVINNLAYILGGIPFSSYPLCVSSCSSEIQPACQLFLSVYDVNTENYGYAGTYIATGPPIGMNSTTAFVINNSIITIGGSTSGNSDKMWQYNPEFALYPTSIPGLLCPGSTFEIEFHAVGFNPNNIFSVFLSDSSGCITTLTSYNIGSVSGTSSGAIPVTIPNGLPSGNHYSISIVSTDPYYVSYKMSNVVIQQSAYGIITASGPTQICNGDTVILTAPQSSSYLWNIGEITQSISVTKSGTYSVESDINTGCSVIPPAITVTYHNNGITNGVQWKTPFRNTNASGRPEDIIQTSDGGYIWCGDRYLVKLNADGDTLWKKIFPFSISMSGITEVNDGYVLVGDLFNGGLNSNAYIFKVDHSGNVIGEEGSWGGEVSTPVGYSRFLDVKPCADYSGFIAAGFTGETSVFLRLLIFI